MLDNDAAAVQPPGGTWLVTGARGFIGGHLIRRLHDAGCKVIAVDLQRPDKLTEHDEFVYCDISRPEMVARSLGHRRADFAVHLAARVGDWGSYDDFAAVNVRGTRHVLEGLWRAGCGRIIHFSSIAAMGFGIGRDADERVAPVTHGDHYSVTKAEGELAAIRLQERGAPLTIIRPGDIYGVGCVPWVKRPVEMLRRRQLLLVDGGRGLFAHVHVDNLLDATFLAAASERAVGNTYIVTDGDDDTSFGDYFSRLADAAGLPRPKVSLPRGAAMAMGRGLVAVGRTLGIAPPITDTAVRFVSRRATYSIERASRDLGYRPRVTLDDGLEALAESGALR